MKEARRIKNTVMTDGLQAATEDPDLPNSKQERH
jgi:hypothetical protein